jgi:hypothetical protein
MVATDKYIAEVFPEPPLIGEYLIRAKVPTHKSRSKREIKGMTKCNKPCHACPFIMEGKEGKSDNLHNCTTNRGYIKRMFPTKETGIHLNQRGHSVSDVRITILLKMKRSDKSYRKVRERYLINKFNTYYMVFGNEHYKSVCLFHRLEMCSQNKNLCQKLAIYRTF